MELKLNIPLQCPKNIEPFLGKVFQGEYDVDIHLPRGARILDLGANCGAFALWAAHRWPGCEVMCFEPHPKVFEMLQMNTQAYPQIQCHNWGIGRPGMRVLNHGKHNCGESSFHAIMNNPTPTGLHCEVADPLSMPEADCLKMDIEGCELEVLEPLIAAGRRPSLVLLEYHNHEIRRHVDRLLEDYVMIGGEMTTMFGLGVAKYLRNDLFEKIKNASVFFGGGKK